MARVATPSSQSLEQVNARQQRALVRRILRVRPDVSPAQLVGILGGRLLSDTHRPPRP